jgi:hypothetical protein
MKRLLLATVIACLATSASAGTVKLPEEFLGTWCIADRMDEITSLQRTGCDADSDEVVIRQDSIDLAFKCKLVKNRRLSYGNADTFVMFYLCDHLVGQKNGKLARMQSEWHVEMVMKHGDLFLNTKRSGR